MLKDVVATSQMFCCKKEIWGYAKVIHKKRKKKKKVEKKRTSVRDIQNNGYLDVCLKKKEKDEYDSPCFLAKLFPISKERYVFNEHSRIRLATYISTIHAHTCAS